MGRLSSSRASFVTAGSRSFHDVGAVPEFAIDRRNAMVVRAGDVAAMTDRLDAVLSDGALRTRLSIEGRKTAAAYELAKVAPLFEAALQRALIR